MQARRWPAWIVAFTLVFSLFLSIGGTTVYADDEEGGSQTVDTGAVTTNEEGDGNTGEGDTGEGEGDTGEGEGDTGEGEGDTGEGEGATTSDETEVGIAAEANFNIFSTDGAIFQVRSWDGSACGDIVDGPETVSGGSATFTVDDAGTYCVELVSPPPGYQLSGDSVNHFASGYIVKTYTELQFGWTVTFEEIPTREFTLRTFDATTGSNVPLDGAVYNILDADGNPIDPTNFPGLTNVTTTGGSVVLTVPDAAIRIQLVTRPAGYQLTGDSVFHFENNNTTGATSASDWSVLFAQIPSREFTLRSFDATSGTNVPLDGAVYNILDASGNPIDSTDFPGLTNVTTTGGSVVLTVPDAPIRIQLVSAPANYELTGDSVFHFQNSGLTDPIGPGTNDWSVLFAQITGDLEVNKWFCLVEDEEDARVEFDTPYGAIQCETGIASFELYYDSDYVDTFTTGDDGIASVPDLPVGSYRIVEIGSEAYYDFTISAGETTTVNVTNYVYLAGKVKVTKYYCPAKKDRTKIFVEYPLMTVGSDDSPDIGKKCWTGKADFEIWLYGDSENAISFSTGKKGTAWLTLPITTSDTGPHTIVEVDSGKSATFEVYRDEKTDITVINEYKKKPHHHHDKPHKPHKPGKDDGKVEVDTLPSTGTGSTMNSDAFFFAAGSMILFGLGVATTRRRWLQ